MASKYAKESKNAGKTRVHPIKLTQPELDIVDAAVKIAYEWNLIEKESRYGLLRFAVKSVSDELVKRYNSGTGGNRIEESEEEERPNVEREGINEEYDSREILDEER